MKIRSSFFSLCALLFVAGALFTSCTQTNTPTTASKGTPVVSLAGTSYVDVTSLSDNQLYEFTVAGSSSATVINGFSSYANGTVRVFWTRGTGDTGMDTIYYRTTSSTTASSGYQIWATADITSGIRIYETADNTTGHPSGLLLGSTSVAKSIGGVDSTNVDLILETDNKFSTQPYLSFDGADVLIGSTTHKTRFSINPFEVLGGLMNQHNSADVSGIFPAASNDVTLFNSFANYKDSSLVFVVRTGDNHYARVEVVPQSNGRLFALGANNRYYIDVNVAYQSMAGWGYVSRPPSFIKGLAKRVSVGEAIHQ